MVGFFTCSQLTEGALFVQQLSLVGIGQVTSRGDQQVIQQCLSMNSPSYSEPDTRSEPNAVAFFCR